MKRSAPAETHFLERDEMEDLLRRLPRQGRLSLRDQVLILLLYNSWARAQEVADLRTGHLQLGEHSLVRLHGKGDKRRTCPLWRQTAELLEQLIASTGKPLSPETPVFSANGRPLTRFGISKVVCRPASDLDDSRTGRSVRPHLFRHTTAVHLLEAGVEVNVIRGWLGHADFITTNRYAEINTRAKIEALRATEPPNSSAGLSSRPVWRTDESLLNWALLPLIRYVAEIAGDFPFTAPLLWPPPPRPHNARRPRAGRPPRPGPPSRAQRPGRGWGR
jgi:integrase/recombinase XerD